MPRYDKVLSILLHQYPPASRSQGPWSFFKQEYRWQYHIQGDQKVSVHLMITVQKTAKIQCFKQVQSTTMIK